MNEYFNHQSKQSSSFAGEKLSDLVRQHSSAVLRHVAATAKRMGLETSELAALEHLQAAGSMVHKRLGERLSLSPGAITSMIDRLERRGYVERIPNPEDRRSALVRITKSGLEESLGHLWPYIEEMKGVEEGFSEEERAVVARFLRAATRATQRAAEGDEWAHGIAGRYSGSSTGASRNKRSCLLARTYADFRELYFSRCWVKRDI